MPLLETTKTIQNQLGTYCQTGDKNINIKGVRTERLPHYRRLVFNVIKNTLSSAYPLTKKLVGNDAFQEMCHDFFSNHACQEPQVYKMTGEFADYFNSRPNNQISKAYPFISELLNFEWTEMDMYMMENVKHPKPKTEGDWMYDYIMLNPESRLLQYNYPVFRKKPGSIEESDKALYYCFAFRQSESGKVIFLDISPVIAVVISEIAEGHNLEYIFKALEENGVELNENQRNSILLFLKTESKSGMTLGFYT